MSTDYNAVRDALAKGTDVAMLCTTCPWDRNCVTPPTMTRAEVDKRITDASAKDDATYQQAMLAGKSPGLPAAAILTALMISGKDMQGTFCPVFALRLRSSGGRKIADTLKSSMQGWDDQS